MNVIYEGTDITGEIQVASMVTTDNASGLLDSIELKLIDKEGLWSSWSPKNGDKIEVVDEDYHSGVCYIDTMGQSHGKHWVKALSAPMIAKTTSTRSWEEVTLLQLAIDVASGMGMAVKTCDIVNHTYKRMEQLGQSGLQFLKEICKREGYGVKVKDNHVIVFSEEVLEKQQPIMTLDYRGFDGSPTLTMGEYLYGGCSIWGEIPTTFVMDHNKVTLTSGLTATSVGEGQRWCKGLLRHENKGAITIKGSVKRNTKLWAGAVVSVVNMGLMDGRYLIDQVEHDTTEISTSLVLHKCLEGY